MTDPDTTPRPVLRRGEGNQADWERLKDMIPAVQDTAYEIVKVLGVLVARFNEQHGQFSVQHLLHALDLAGATMISMVMHNHRDDIPKVIEGWAEMIRGMAHNKVDESGALTEKTVREWIGQGCLDLETRRAEKAIGAALTGLLHQPKKGDRIN